VGILFNHGAPKQTYVNKALQPLAEASGSKQATTSLTCGYNQFPKPSNSWPKDDHADGYLKS